MNREVVLFLFLVASFVAGDDKILKFDFDRTLPLELPKNFNESFANLTRRKEDAEVNLVAVDLLLDAIYEALDNEESNVTIPEDIDPQQTPISVQDAVVRVSEFMGEQTLEVQDLLAAIEQIRKKLMSISVYSWFQRKTVKRQQLRVLRLKKVVSDLYRNYTETGDEISKLYDSLASTDKDFDDDYEYDYSLVSEHEENNSTDTEPEKGEFVGSYDSGDGAVEDSDGQEEPLNSTIRDLEGESTTTTTTNPEWEGEELYHPDLVEDYSETEDNSDWYWKRVSTTTSYTTTQNLWKWSSFVNPWKTYASGDDRDSSQGETEKENNWLASDKPFATQSEESPWLREDSNWLFDWTTLSTTTFSTFSFWDSSLYHWNDYPNSDLEEKEEVFHYTDNDDYSSYSDSGIYAGAIIGAVILKITFWVMIIRCRYRYRTRLCYRTTLTVTPPRNVRRIRRLPNAPRSGVSATAGREGTTTNAPTPQDDLPTYVEAVANDVPTPPKYEDCHDDTCVVDLATPNDLPAPPAYSSDVPKEEDKNTTTSDEVPLISEEV